VGQGRWRRVSPEMRREVRGLVAAGLSRREIMSRLDLPRGTLDMVVGPLGGVIRKDMLVESGGKRLSLEERVDIYVGLERGWSLRHIGDQLRRAASTVCREVAANGGRVRYRPVTAHKRAFKLARRPKVTKLGSDPALRDQVVEDLEQLWSPQQIARRLRQTAGGDASVGTVSHETIYKSIYIQGRGELRRELARCLRSGRASRRPQGRMENRGRIADMIMISERPAEAEDRAVPGHWEGDLIVGKDGRSHIATLVERSTRYVLLAKIDQASAETVTAALVERVATLPSHLWRSLTWDQGKELADHLGFSIATRIPVYFCDPHSPWQRGSNENTNGLLRQYFPKGTNLSVHSQEELDRVAIQLNGRPRETLGWQTPAERLAPLLVATTP
jgi:IS30 family transposase